MSFKSEWEAKKSLYFDGTDAALTVSRPGAGAANLNPTGTEAFSVSLWFYDISDYYGALAGNSTTSSASTAIGWNITYYANQLRWWFGDGAGNRRWSYFTFANYSRLQWNHFVMTYDGAGNLKGYYNNARTLWETQSNSGTLGSIDSSADIKMGTGGAYADFWKGSLSNVAYWSKELSGPEVNEVYKGRNGNIGAGNLNRHSAQSNLVSWWIGDDSSDAYNGTIHDQKGSFDASAANFQDGDLGYGAP